jgi:hypothetical protein
MISAPSAPTPPSNRDRHGASDRGSCRARRHDRDPRGAIPTGPFRFKVPVQAVTAGCRCTVTGHGAVPGGHWQCPALGLHARM